MIIFNLGDIGLNSKSSSGEFLSGIGSEKSGSVSVWKCCYILIQQHLYFNVFYNVFNDDH